MKFHCLNRNCDLVAEVISYKKNQLIHCPHCNSKMLAELQYNSIRHLFDRADHVSDNDVQKVLDEKEKILHMSANGLLKEFQNYVQAFYKLLIDPDALRVHKAITVIALLYLISPIDLIPDFIPGAGHLDDLAVILTAVSLIGKIAIAAYLETNKALEKQKQADDELLLQGQLQKLPLILKIAESKRNTEICEYIENDQVRYWQVSQNLLNKYNIKTADNKICRFDALYIRHPYLKNQLLELDGFDDYIVKQKREEYKILASSLGAQSIVFEDRIITSNKNNFEIDAKVAAKVDFNANCEIKNAIVKKSTENLQFFASPIDFEMAVLDRLLWIYDEPDQAKNLCYRRIVNNMKGESSESTYFSEKYFSVKSKIELKEMLSQINASFQSTNSMAIRSQHTIIYEPIDLNMEKRREIYDKIAARIDGRINEIKQQQF